MKKLILIFMFMTSTHVFSQVNDTVSILITEIEKTALARWYNGDPSGYLEIYADDICYFDPWTESRLDGLNKLKELYEPLRGKIHVEKYEIIHPKVQPVNDMAVLTYNLTSYTGEIPEKWNCTEIYRLDKDKKWKIIHSHWSLTKLTQ